MSHPVWVRGLKQTGIARKRNKGLSHPVWVRGLKQRENKAHGADIVSHPVWVRGLKLSCTLQFRHQIPVAPRVGAWIETWNLFVTRKTPGVAPRVGAWIETFATIKTIYPPGWSHPVWVRGLKRRIPGVVGYSL